MTIPAFFRRKRRALFLSALFSCGVLAASARGFPESVLGVSIGQGYDDAIRVLFGRFDALGCRDSFGLDYALSSTTADLAAKLAKMDAIWVEGYYGGLECRFNLHFTEQGPSGKLSSVWIGPRNPRAHDWGWDHYGIMRQALLADLGKARSETRNQEAAEMICQAGPGIEARLFLVRRSGAFSFYFYWFAPELEEKWTARMEERYAVDDPFAESVDVFSRYY